MHWVANILAAMSVVNIRCSLIAATGEDTTVTLTSAAHSPVTDAISCFSVCPHLFYLTIHITTTVCCLLSFSCILNLTAYHIIICSPVYLHLSHIHIHTHLHTYISILREIMSRCNPIDANGEHKNKNKMRKETSHYAKTDSTSNNDSVVIAWSCT